MRTRRLLLSAAGGASGLLAAAAALTAHGQDPAPPPAATEAKYYQGKVSPPPPGLFPQRTTVRPGGAPPAPPKATPPVPAKSAPAANGWQPPAGPKAAPVSVNPPANKARFTQPVIAGPDGVVQVGGTSQLPQPSLPTPVLPPPAGLLPLPSVAVDPGKPKLPDPKPLGDIPALAVPPGRPNFDPPSVTAEPAPLAPPTVAASEPAPPTAASVSPAAPAAPPKPAPPAPKVAFQEPPVGGPPPAAGSPRATPSVVVELNAPAEVGVNQPLTYELVLRNVGPVAVHSVRLDDELPAKSAFVGSDPTAETTGDRLVWALGTLDAGAERRVRVTVRPGEEGEVRSRASVSYAASVEARVRVTRPKVTVAVTEPGQVRVGDKVPFQIKLSNTGTGTAGSVKLQAKFSDGLGHPSGQVIEAELPGLKAGESRTLNLDGVTGLKSGSHALTLTATADAAPPEHAKAVVTLVEPLLTMKQAGPARCLVKGEPTFTIELANPGTAATDPVQVWAALPPGFEFVSATENGAVADGKQVGWRLPGLAPAATKTLALKVRAVAPAEGVLRTVASCPTQPEAAAGLVQVEGRAPTGRGLEARAETPVKAEGVPALRFEVAGQEGTVEVGKEAVYDIRIMNQGTGPCTNVQVTAELADGTTIAGATGHTPARSDRQAVTFDPIPTFGVKGEVVYRVRVRGTTPGDHRFRVRLVCDQVRTPVVKEENTRFYNQ